MQYSMENLKSDNLLRWELIELSINNNNNNNNTILYTDGLCDFQ